MADINNSANSTVISGGSSGNNIYNTGNNVEIHGGNSTRYPSVGDYIENTGNNATIYAYAKDDEIINRAGGSGSFIDTGNGNDKVTNYGKNTTIYSGYGNDTITTYGDGTQVTLGTDNNSVNAYANNVVVKVSRGNQTIQSKAGTGTSIQGGVSDDNITVQKNGSGNGVVATINGGTGNDTFTGSAGAEVFVYANNDGNDVIYGWTANDTLLLTSGSVSESTTNDSGDVIIGVGYGSITIKDAANKKINIAKGSLNTGGGSDTMDNGSGDDTSPSEETAVTLASSFTGLYDAYGDEDKATIKKIDASKVKTGITIYTNSNNTTVTGSTKGDVIFGNSGKDVINSGNGDDMIYGEEGNDTLNAGAGDDYLTGGKGNDTLTGGAGADTFFYYNGDGNDIITDYSDTQGDEIFLDVSSMSTQVSGNDVILKVGSGKITINNGKGKKISVVGGNYETTVVSSSGGSTTTLPNGLSYTTDKKTLNAKAPFTGTIDLSKYASTVTTVNASTDTKFVSIKGTTRAETLKAGKCGSILTGGKGNDKLYGGSGADTFVYANGDGKDTIYNYTAYIDTIKVTSGKISRASVSGNNVVLTVGSGSITINNAKGKDINITDSSGETKTYNFTTTVNNPTTSNYEERWFAEDDNFGIDSQLDSIVKTSDNNYSIGNISSTEITNTFAKNTESLVKVAQSNLKK